MIDTRTGGTHPGQMVSTASSPQVAPGASSMEAVPLANKPILEKKAAVYAEVVRNLNNARERGLPFKVRVFFSILITILVFYQVKNIYPWMDLLALLFFC